MNLLGLCGRSGEKNVDFCSFDRCECVTSFYFCHIAHAGTNKSSFYPSFNKFRSGNLKSTCLFVFFFSIKCVDWPAYRKRCSLTHTISANHIYLRLFLIRYKLWSGVLTLPTNRGSNCDRICRNIDLRFLQTSDSGFGSDEHDIEWF